MFLTFLLFITANLHVTQATATIVQLKWTNPMAVYDAAVSDDGNYLAAVNDTGLYYFDTDNSTPAWQYQPPTVIFRSVAISADGDYVVAGDNNGFLHYFNQSRIRIGNQTLSTWTSSDMGGPVEKGTLDMSANGNYTIVGGTGITMWYYANCINREGTKQNTTWASGVGYDFLTVHISANGKYVAGGGNRGSSNGFVVFYDDATTRTGYVSPTWYAWSQLDTIIMDLALSDDGYAVAAISADILTLHYWANATKLTGDPNAAWTNPGSFSCIDMNADGNKVVTGGYYMTSLHFWDNCRARNGMQPEDWVKLETTNVYDVAISKDGNSIAAPTMNLPSNYTAYFLYSNGTIINDYSLPAFANMVSMSADGTTVTMAGPGYDSLYLFKIETDSTPPAINDVWQQPNSTSVYPNDNANVFANVTDDLSGVHQVTLNYTTGNGTWFTQPMDRYSRELWNGTIPGFPYCTTITYVITAQDNANNTITSQELGYTLQYHVIPEIPTSLATLLLMIAISALTAIGKKKRKT